MPTSTDGRVPQLPRLLAPELAADIVWLDAYLTNVDRTPRNTNLLVTNQQVWLIDHGAALFMHHRWSGWRARIQSPFPQFGEHVLLPFADLAAQRQAYVTYQTERLNGARTWLAEAIAAQQRGPRPLGLRETHRRE